jgi:hypothetical protein
MENIIKANKIEKQRNTPGNPPTIPVNARCSPGIRGGFAISHVFSSRGATVCNFSGIAVDSWKDRCLTGRVGGFAYRRFRQDIFKLLNNII